jgi:cystathionine beta-lyase/cystathionine gamma-synthase
MAGADRYRPFHGNAFGGDVGSFSRPGGVESLISLPALMTHASTPREVRAALGITDCLVQISVGIEDCDDLITDLRAALG